MDGCAITCLVITGIVAVYFIGCIFLQVPYWNRTVVTHAIPNFADFIGYQFSGKPTTEIATPGEFENGTKFADFESLIDRVRRTDNKYTYFPPKCLIHRETSTFDMDKRLLFKFDSVPSILRDVALPRLSSHDPQANIRHKSGSSIFVTNYEDRGPNNEMKRKYMEGLSATYIADYVQRCENVMYDALYCMGNKTHNPHHCIFEAVKRITFIVHTHLEPEEIDKQFIETGAAAFSAVSGINELSGVTFMPIITQQHILKHDMYIARLKKKLEDGTYKGLFKSLKDNQYREEDILVEYLHNILALTLQWTIIMEELVDTSSPGDGMEFIYNHVKQNPTAAFVISAMDDIEVTNKIHFMKEIMEKHPQGVNLANAKKCPFNKQWIHTPEDAVVASDTTIIEEEGNWGFGRGYRRCAGEVLTIEMMKKWIEIIHQQPYTYVKGERNGTFGFGYEHKSTFTIN
jgi:hypothetical protein